MSISYILEPRDLRAFQEYCRKYLPGLRRLRFAGMIFLTVVSLWLALIAEDHRPAFRILYFLVVFLILLIISSVLRIVFTRLAHWRTYSSEKQMSILCQHTVTLADDALIQATAVNQNRSLWRGICEVVDAPEHIYIFTSLHSAHIIPKRAFPDAATAGEFYERAAGLQVNATNALALGLVTPKDEKET